MDRFPSTLVLFTIYDTYMSPHRASAYGPQDISAQAQMSSAQSVGQWD